MCDFKVPIDKAVKLLPCIRPRVLFITGVTTGLKDFSKKLPDTWGSVEVSKVQNIITRNLQSPLIVCGNLTPSQIEAAAGSEHPIYTVVFLYDNKINSEQKGEQKKLYDEFVSYGLEFLTVLI